MANKKEKCGYTREMYPPKKEGKYLIKNEDLQYEVAEFKNNEWITPSNSRVFAWIEIPKTEINTPF